MLKLNLSPFFSPNDTTGAVEDKELGKEEVIKLLGEDDDKEEPLEIKEDKKESKTEEDKEEVIEEDDELKEIEEELEEPDEEKLELMTPVRRKEILKAYPDLFKKFPYLERAYYREQQFTELLPTIDDAKQAVEKANILDMFSADISSGNLEKAIQAVKGSGEQAFNNLVDSYLPNLFKVDKEAYYHVTGNIVKSIVKGMIAESKNSNDADLEAAARIAYKYVFGNNNVSEPTNVSREVKTDDREEQLRAKEQEIVQKRFESSLETISTKVDNTLKATIEANIDPKSSMTDYVRKNASREAFENLDKMLSEDRRLQITVDKLWENAKAKDFSQASLDMIKSTVLSRAKALLPTVIKQARNNALKGLGKRVREDSEESGPKKGPLPVGRSASSSSSSSGKSDSEKAKAIPRNMSSREYLMSDD